MEIAELVICAIVVYFAIMMLAFAIVVSKRTRGRNHRNIQEGCIMGGRKTASFVSATHLFYQPLGESQRYFMK